MTRGRCAQESDHDSYRAAHDFQHIPLTLSNMSYISFRRGARYRELKPFVRIWKGFRNIAEQNLLAFQMLYAQARLTINNLKKENNLDQSGHFFDKICFFYVCRR